MSLTLLQGYSSAEEDPEPASDDLSSSADEDDHLDSQQHQPQLEHSSSSFNAPPKSHLPSAFDAFSQISAPPQFLNNSVGNQSSIDVRDSAAFRGRRKSKDKKDLPPGVVVEAKAQLVGIHERVRSDIDPPPSSSDQTKPEAARRLLTATNPDAKDASELLRMCLECGIPKTYSNARGMVCPECSDRPPAEEPTKKKGSAVKDKEKNKRMKGQSTHATWKSETEMQLRQQFD